MREEWKGTVSAAQETAPVAPQPAPAHAPVAPTGTSPGPSDEFIEARYFREMSSIPFPTRTRELEIAERIQRARAAAKTLIGKPPSGVRSGLQSYKAMRGGRLVLDPQPEIVGERILQELGEMLHGSRLRRVPAKHRKAIRAFQADMSRGLDAIRMAKNDLIEANLRLVIHIANRYRNHPLPLMDLIQEGNLGLMKAVDKFEVDKGYRFSTYAVWWIRQYIKRAVENQGAAIRMPIYIQDARRRVLRSSHDLWCELGRKPMATEIANREGIPAERVQDLLDMRNEALSLDVPIGAEDERRLEEVIPDASVVSPFEVALESELNEEVQKALATLPPREEQIVRLRFGIGHPTGLTLREISRMFNLTHERIRQIEVRALERLRSEIGEKGLRAIAEN